MLVYLTASLVKAIGPQAQTSTFRSPAPLEMDCSTSSCRIRPLCPDHSASASDSTCVTEKLKRIAPVDNHLCTVERKNRDSEQQPLLWLVKMSVTPCHKAFDCLWSVTSTSVQASIAHTVSNSKEKSARWTCCGVMVKTLLSMVKKNCQELPGLTASCFRVQR